MLSKKIVAIAERALVLCLCALLLPAPAFAWGDKGHRIVNRLAWQHLPAEMPAFLRAAAIGNQIETLAPEPDRWRSPSTPELNAAQAPEHFINLESADRIGPLPRERWQFVHALYAFAALHPAEAALMAPEKVGLQPWETEEIEQRLQIAFHQWRDERAQHRDSAATEQDIIFYMGWLGHYVADGSQPLHTTVQFNGWKGANPHGYTTDKNFHERFETFFVDNNISAAQVAPFVSAARPLPDVFENYVRYLQTSNALVPMTYQLEQRGGFTGAGTAESRQFVAQRLAAAATMLDALWLTAWQDSAR